MIIKITYCSALIFIWMTVDVTRRFGNSLRGQATMRLSNIHSFLGFAANPIGLALLGVGGFLYIRWFWVIGFIVATYIIATVLSASLFTFVGREIGLSKLKMALDLISVLLVIGFFTLAGV